jgi:ligand-binding SRPBCC domain-containing protein
MIYHYQTEQKINKPLDQLFSFFSQAENLQQITPPWLRFKILTPLPVTMHAGTLIDYRLRLYGVPLYWQTEITVWEPPFRFIDSQIKGPYKSWIHTHTFRALDDGCLMEDNVQYQLYGGMLGSLINGLLVKRDIEKIFDYRREMIEKLFL